MDVFAAGFIVFLREELSPGPEVVVEVLQVCSDISRRTQSTEENSRERTSTHYIGFARTQGAQVNTWQQKHMNIKETKRPSPTASHHTQKLHQKPHARNTFIQPILAIGLLGW